MMCKTRHRITQVITMHRTFPMISTNVSIGSPYPNSPYHWWLTGYPDAGNVTVVEQAVVICSSNNNPNKPTKRIWSDSWNTQHGVYVHVDTRQIRMGISCHYLFDWGDGTNSSWVGPYVSGATASANHAWSASGTYQVKAKAKDTLQAQSIWSDSLSVTMSLPPIFGTPTPGNGSTNNPLVLAGAFRLTILTVTLSHGLFNVVMGKSTVELVRRMEQNLLHFPVLVMRRLTRSG